MKKLLAGLTLSAPIVALVVLASLPEEVQAANVVITTTKLALPAEVVDMHFQPSTLADGGRPVVARVCGHTIQLVNGADAGFTDVTCYDITLAQTNSVAQTINGLADRDGGAGGGATSFWKGKEGL